MAIDPIRASRPADLPDIVRLIHALAAYERLSDRCIVTEAILGPQLFGPDPGAHCLVVEIAGDTGPAIVGFALYFHNFSTFLGKPGLYLEDLYIEPEQRGRGFGKALLQRLGAIAVERGCGRFEWSVLDWNVDAIAFYESMGATLMSDWRICRISGDALAAFGRR